MTNSQVDFSFNFLDFINLMIKYDDKQRPDADKMLKHKFIVRLKRAGVKQVKIKQMLVLAHHKKLFVSKDFKSILFKGKLVFSSIEPTYFNFLEQLRTVVDLKSDLNLSKHKTERDYFKEKFK